jgi:transposase
MPERLIKLSNRMGRGYSYEIIRAKTLYAKHARKVGSGVRLSKPRNADSNQEHY